MMCSKKFNNRFCAFCSVLLLLAFRIDFASAVTVDRVVAKVNGAIITQSNVHNRFMLDSNKSDKQNAGPIINERVLMENALNSIIIEKLQIQDAKRNEYKVSEDSLNSAFNSIKKNNNISDQQFEMMLKNEDRSLEDYKEILRDQMLISKISRARLGKKSMVSSDQIKSYYNKHLKNYWEPPKVKVRHILFVIEKGAPIKEINFKRSKAREILSKVRAGEKFSKMVRKYSEDISAQTGGDVGIVERGTMVREFEEAAFRLKVGEVSEIIKTSYGLHIIKCDKIFPAFSKPLSQVKGDIENLLRDQNQKQAYESWIKDLKKSAYIEISLFENHSDGDVNRSSIKKPKIANLKEDKFFKNIELKKNIKSKNHIGSEKTSKRDQKIIESMDLVNYRLIAKRLKHYKKMRDRNKISELEYMQKKKELLKNF